MTNLKAAAQEYLKAGLNVVTVKQKKPLVEWAQWQTRGQMREEFENQPWSIADGFAILCGTKMESSLYVAAVDFDVKNGGEEAQAKGKEILKQLLATHIEGTPSGGQHWIYWTHTKPRTLSVFHNQCGLELLGEGKAGFKPQKEKPEKAKAEVWFGRQDLSGKRFTGKTPPCIDALYRGTEEGERNEQTLRLASYLANFRGMRPDHVLEQLRRTNRFNNPPLQDKELQNILKSTLSGGYIYGCQDPVLKKYCRRDECSLAPADMGKELSGAETERAQKILNQGNLLNHVLSYGKRHLIGEDNALQSNFIMFLSGRTRYPISGVVSGFSGSGKNQSIRAIKPLIPKDWYFEFTTSTPEVMKYLPEEFQGTLVIYEALGVKGDIGSLSLRAIGEGESIETIYPMRNERTGKMEMGRAKTNAKNFITTSSGIDINPDLYRRVLKTSMNHSTELTKQVMAKKIHDAAYPDSLKAILGMEEQMHFTEEDFQNKLSLINWKLEVAAFTPPELLELLDLAVKREQEVALRTHIEKIVNFTNVLALLNQSQRLRARIGEAEYVVAEPQDFQTALQILSVSIRETICRIEKRQEEALQLFTTGVSLTKNDVAIKLKVSTRTANRVLKTLSQAGYLKEDVSSKAYRYELLEKEPKHHALLEMTRSIGSFHQSSLKTWLNTIVTSGQEKQLATSFCVDGAWTSTPPQILEEVTMEDPNLEDQNIEASVSEEIPDGTDLAEYENNDKTDADIEEHELCGEREEDIADANNAQTPKNNDPSDLNIACPDVTMLSTPETSLNSEEADIDHANLERTLLQTCNSEMNSEKPFFSLRQLASARRTYAERKRQKCQVCGKTTLTSCQAETFSRTSVWLCEDCYEMWNRHVGTEQG